MKTDKSRLTVLLIILVALMIAFGVVFYYYGPYSEAAKGGIKGKPEKSATPTATPTPTATSSPSPTATPSTAILFSDDFSGSLSKWQIVYTEAKIDSQELDLIPSNQTYNLPTDTHAPLIAGGDSSWKDYIYTVKMKTVRQLRPSNPNPWEVGWIVFRYKDAQNFYYFIQKPNGIELGRVIPGSQRFMYTAETPILNLNAWNTYKIAVKGANIKIWINGTQVVDYTDTAADTILAGKIGLYNEDAQTRADEVMVVAN